MSADPYIQAPDMLQSYNRYAYVMNNPLNLTDPSGYWSFRSIFRTVVAIAIAVYAPQFISSYLAQAAGAAAAAGLTGASAAAAYGVGYAAAYGAVSTAIISGAVAGFASALVSSGGDARAAAVGALSGGLFAGVGASFSAGSTGSYLGHAAVGCITSVAGGGACGSGAASALFGKFTTVQTQDWGTGIAQFTAATVSGGVGSVIAGGKFQNGAVTAAYGYLFNQLQTNGQDPNTRGNMAVEQAKQAYVENGFFIYGEQVTAIINGLPNRIYDFVAIDTAGNYYGVEVKSSLFDVFKLNSQQVKFDTAVYDKGAAIAASALQITRVGYVGIGWGGSLVKNFSSARLYNQLQDNGINVITAGGSKTLK